MREVEYLTVFAGIAQGAGAAVGTQSVNARALIQARVRVALIDVMEAEGTRETHRAQAREGVDSVNARATIETGAEEQTGDNISHAICRADLLPQRWLLGRYKANTSETLIPVPSKFYSFLN